MKKIKAFLATAIASAFICLGGAFAPVTAFAEESTETPEISVESVTSEEVVEETESVENSSVLEAESDDKEGTEITFDDILNLAGKLAEKEGFKDEWDKTLYYLKTAASEKKVDAMIILLGAVFAFLLLYSGIKLRSWYKKIKTDTTSKDLTDIKKESGQQTKAINSLIDEDEKLVGEVAAASAREKVMTEALEQQNIALRALIRGTQIKQDLKDEAFRALNKSDELCDIAKK